MGKRQLEEKKLRKNQGAADVAEPETKVSRMDESPSTETTSIDEGKLGV